MSIEFTSDNDDHSDGSEVDEVEGAESAREILALCLRGNRLGCARYRPCHCRVEVFEVPVFLGVELTTSTNARGEPSYTSARSAGGSKRPRVGAIGCVRLLHRDDVPPSLLWLCQYVELHSPIALLADSGADLLADVLSVSGGCTVLRLGAETGFNASRALPQLCVMYPQLSTVDMKARFNMRHTSMMAAMAALLQYVSTLRLNVADVVERGPASILYMNSETLSALQITRQDAHPCSSSAQGTHQAKEGLSLLTVIDHTMSSMGRALLRQWLLLPSCDAEEIRRRQEVVALFLAPQHHELLLTTRRALRGVHNTNHLFTLIRRGHAHRHHYQTLHKTLQAVLTVHALVAPFAHECPLLFDLVVNHCRLDVLQGMMELLQRTVHGVRGATGLLSHRAQPALPELTFARSEMCRDAHLSINSEADSSGLLGELRLHLQSLGNALDYHAQDAFHTLDASMREIVAVRCVYISPYGYLVCTSRTALRSALQFGTMPSAAWTTAATSAGQSALAQTDTMTPGTDLVPNGADTSTLDASSEGWAQTAGYMQQRYGWTLHHEDDNNDLCYFKTTAMANLDAKVGDLQRRIVERESELRRDVDESLLYRSLHLLAPCRTLAILDCLLAFSHVAQQYQWCQPHLVEDRAGVVDIDAGWHPVLCRAIGTSAVQPFSLQLGRDDTERVCVVTGQNGSGKSVLLSSVALIVLLTQMGSFVPASAASLSVFSSIWTSSASPDEHLHGSTAGTSSFASECLAVNRLLRYCDGAQAASCAAYEDDKGNHTDTSHALPVPLILLDEFGKGTAAEDGRALLGAVVRHFCAPATTRCDALPGAHGRASAVGATVLCTTHHIDMLWNGTRQTRFPDLAFPYERVMIVDMRGEPVYDDKASTPAELGRIPLDIIPAFQPHVVTSRPFHHERDFLAYQSQLFVDAAVGGHQVGLPDEILDEWKHTLAVLASSA